MIHTAFQPHQASDVEQLFLEVFSKAEGAAEGQLIADLVHQLIATTTPSDLLGFVTQQQDKLVAGIFFTPLRFDGSARNVMLLSPVAVRTDYQRQGIGQALIKHGIAELRQQQVELLMTYGDPNFYSKVGFAAVAETTIHAPLQLSYPHGWLGQPLQASDIAPIEGSCHCVAALNQHIYW